MIIEIAETAGYCFGVERAVRIAEKAADDSGSKTVYTLGPIIHNELVLEKLKKEKNVSVLKDMKDVHEATVVIRAHGIPPGLYRQADAQDNRVMDATCPYVTRAQELAKKLVEDDYQLILLGEPKHPEIIGIQGHAGGRALVVSQASELPDRPYWGRVGIVVQTTQRPEKLAELINKLIPITHELKVHNTICDATARLQEAAHELSKRVETMVVIGSKLSGNTKRLAQICAEHQPHTYLITEGRELKEEWFQGIEHVGITAGASTPDFSIQEVVDWLRAYAERREPKLQAAVHT
jgi:4-hydroxy-3-methylbut-2-enyl diphosphate reductase